MRLFAIFLIAASPLLSWAQAQKPSEKPAWPTQPVKLVVGFPAGSSPDLTARVLAEPMSKMLGQPVVVENKVGAGGNIAAEAVAKATDQHTLGVMINGNLTTAKRLNPRLGYDPLKDFAPIGLIATSPLVLVTTPALGAGGYSDFVKAARAAGNRWNFGSPGVGTLGHIGTEWLQTLLRTQAVHVPYPGYPQVATALIGEQVQFSMMPPASALAQDRAGKLRALAVTSPGRSALAPQLPSVQELGVAGFELEIWNALAAPKNLPAAVVERLSQTLSQVVRQPEVREKLFQQGWTVVGSSPEGLRLRMQTDAAVFGPLIDRLGLANQP